MASTEPWVTFGRTYEESRVLMTDPTREAYVVWVNDERAGFAVLWMAGPFSGYLQSLCLDPIWRGRGIGGEALKWIEARIFASSSNVFLCVSSFNPDARRMYERAGYVLVGELAEFMVAGHSEFLLRKTRGPLIRVAGGSSQSTESVHELSALQSPSR